mgnify:CR=1 FL=1
MFRFGELLNLIDFYVLIIPDIEPERWWADILKDQGYSNYGSWFSSKAKKRIHLYMPKDLDERTLKIFKNHGYTINRPD